MRGGGDGCARTETVSATLRVSFDHLSVAAERHLFPTGGFERSLQARMEADALQVVQEVLRLVLEAQDLNLGALLDVGERNSRGCGCRG